jgi:hypothetical protein
MKRGFLAVNISVLVLSVGLVMMTDSAPAQDWDQSFSGAARFTLLASFNNAAVRDNNTGLVWEQQPDQSIIVDWTGAMGYCLRKNVGGTVGWRLPSVVELNSLRDPSLPPPYVLTTGSGGVFGPISLARGYWAATLVREDPFLISFADGRILLDTSRSPMGGRTREVGHAWCVRGNFNTDQY